MIISEEIGRSFEPLIDKMQTSTQQM